MTYSNPEDIAAAGQKIYDDSFKKEYELKFPQQFAAIEVDSREAFVGDFPEVALERGRKAHPQGYFHLVKIGSKGAFKVSYTSNASNYGFL